MAQPRRYELMVSPQENAGRRNCVHPTHRIDADSSVQADDRLGAMTLIARAGPEVEVL
jgi:hypothetical protein